MSVPSNTADVAQWASGLIRDARAERGRPLARYGTPAWASMPPRQRWAAVLLAAECWRTESDPVWIAAQLDAELHAHDRVEKTSEDATYQADVRAHRHHWRYLRGRAAPTEWRDDVDEPRDGAA